MTVRIVTAEAPVNIAVIKYWGKRDEDLILPVNDSLSATLSKKQMCSKTTVACSKDFISNRMWLNGKEEDCDSPRIQNCIRSLKRKAKFQELTHLNLHICSRNNFPTAAGLASSAAGFACLVKALAELYGVEDELSTIARQGSGSACRSIYGGFVHWHSGVKEDGSDSAAVQIAPKSHWPEMRVIILVVKSCPKDVGSTVGMKNSILTSSLLHHRTSKVVPERVKEITQAIMAKDFKTFAEITMKDSNQFHAICLDTFPPIHYLNETSFHIIKFVHDYNDFYGEVKVAYTFDAGPNACLYLLDRDVPQVITALLTIFSPICREGSFIKGLKVPTCNLSQDFKHLVCSKTYPGELQYLINTQIGNGPVILQDPDSHLLNSEGYPKP